MLNLLRTRYSRRQSGDTIVEVLIAVAVVSAVIVGAFTIANRSSQQIRASQERSEALKITASAVEMIKSNKSTAVGNTVLNSPRCAVLAPLTQDQFKTFAMVDGGALPALASDKTDSYVAACNSSSNVVYSTSITRVDDSTFQIRTRWDRVGGGDRQEVQIDYRVNQ